MIKKTMTDVVKRMFNRIGFDIVRAKHNPNITLLGIRAIPIDTVIDIGANRGQFAQSILTVFPEAHLYCFEPLPEPFKELEEWAKKHDNVTLFNMALDSYQGTAEMYYHYEHSPSSSLLPTTKDCESVYPFTSSQKKVHVRVEALDKVLTKVELDDAKNVLIKMDVQGFEDRVVKGGLGVLKKARACIFEVCVDHLYEGQANFKDLSMILYDLGYRYAGNLDQIYGEDGHCIYLDAVFIR